MDTRPQPILTAAGLQAAVGAVIALLVAFGLKLSGEQTAAVLGVFAVLGPIVTGFVTRAKVTPLSDPVDSAGRALVPARRVPSSDQFGE
jgi:hypothetical protein